MARLVVIDDDEEVSKMIVHHFERRLGHEVQTFGQAEPALQHLVKNPGSTDLVLVDLGLPDISGFEFISKVRDSEGGRDVPIVVVSARTGLQERARALDVGADAFIEKPFSLKLVEKKVQALLRA